jgi:hypothetical protein
MNQNSTAACLDAEEAAAMQKCNSSDFLRILYGKYHVL